MTWVQWLRAGSGSPEHTAHFESVAIPQITRALLRRRYAETNMTATVRPRALSLFFSRVPNARFHTLRSPLVDGNAQARAVTQFLCVAAEWIATRPAPADDVTDAAWVPFDDVLSGALPLSRDVDTLLRLALD